eukprot:1179846-Prorocentrum_minimum.AAC.3
MDLTGACFSKTRENMVRSLKKLLRLRVFFLKFAQISPTRPTPTPAPAGGAGSRGPQLHTGEAGAGSHRQPGGQRAGQRGGGERAEVRASTDDWSIVRIYPRFLCLIGPPLCRSAQILAEQQLAAQLEAAQAEVEARTAERDTAAKALRVPSCYWVPAVTTSAVQSHTRLSHELESRANHMPIP